MTSDRGVWWRQAEADLATWQTLLRAARFYAVSWFAQQSAEKALKALFVERRGMLAPRTHDLEYLGHELNAPGYVEKWLERLNPAFDISRYLDPTGMTAPVADVSENIAREHVITAESIIAWVRLQLT